MNPNQPPSSPDEAARAQLAALQAHVVEAGLTVDLGDRGAPLGIAITQTELERFAALGLPGAPAPVSVDAPRHPTPPATARRDVDGQRYPAEEIVRWHRARYFLLREGDDWCLHVTWIEDPVLGAQRAPVRYA